MLFRSEADYHDRSSLDAFNRSQKRQKGIEKATDKLSKEEVEIDEEERHMTPGEIRARERIVKGMKKGAAGFKSRYGERAKSVMYATATKQAMKEDAEQLDELGGISTISDEAVNTAQKTTDTLKGRVKGGGQNQHGPDRKVRLAAEEEKNMKESKRPLDGDTFVTNEDEKKSPMSLAIELAKRSFKKIRQETMMGKAATSEEGCQCS